MGKATTEAAGATTFTDTPQNATINMGANAHTGGNDITNKDTGIDAVAAPLFNVSTEKMG